MRVRGARAEAPHKRGVARVEPAAQHHFSPPVRGWILNEGLALTAPGGAKVLDNWICTPDGARVRGGKAKYASISATDAVGSLMAYRAGTVEKLFGTSATSIFDITTVADPDVIPTAAVTGQTSGNYISEQFGTAGGDYLYAVNGADNALLYDGSTWTVITGASSPAITGVSTDLLSFVWTFARRVFFLEKDSLTFWYLPVDSIGGAAASIDLAPVFSKGGRLIIGAKWSLDAGDGLDDKCVFVTSEGEVAVYEGTDPSSGSTWGLAGVYQVSRPLGPKCITKSGGDLLIGTETGLVPMSGVVSQDISRLELSAFSAPIESYWQEVARTFSGAEWHIAKLPAKDIMVVTQPVTAGTPGRMLCANLKTVGWSRLTGWDASCVIEFGAEGYFGAADGNVYLMESGGSDNGAIYTASFLGLHEMVAGLSEVRVTQARALFRSTAPIAPQISVNVDFSDVLPAPPSSSANYTESAWNTAIWDADVWDDGPVKQTVGRWVSIGRTGFAIAPLVQLTFGVGPKPQVDLMSFDIAYEPGAVVN